MKISCESCRTGAASMICLPSNAPLCGPCGGKQRSSVGNKLQKVALETPQEPHKCDICQDAPAYCICIDERAVLCRDCDLSIHKSNKFTEAHSRYLFPGIKLGLEDMSAGKSEPAGAAASGSKRKAPMPLVNNGKQPAMAPPSQPTMRMPTNGGASTSNGTMAMAMHATRLPQNGAMGQYPQVGYDQFGATAAAEFLGVPSLSENFTIKDVDAAYMADEFGSYAPLAVPEDVSHLLEVPDLDFGESMGMMQDGSGAMNNWADDGVVPDLQYH